MGAGGVLQFNISTHMTAAPAHSQSVPRRAAVDSGTVYISGGISGFQGLGFSLLILYLFLIFSRIFDVKLAFLHIPGISYRVIFAMVILSQAFLKALHSDVGKALLVFTVCFVLAVPTSLWKGGSTQILISQWIPAFVVFLAAGGLVADYGQCRRAVLAFAGAGQDAHQAGLFAFDEPVDRSVIANLDQLAAVMVRHQPAWEPGTRQAYHGLTLGFYEGELLRRVDPRHRTLGQFFQDEIATPLGEDFYIRLPEEIPDARLATLSPPRLHPCRRRIYRLRHVWWCCCPAGRQYQTAARNCSSPNVPADSAVGPIRCSGTGPHPGPGSSIWRCHVLHQAMCR